MEKERSLERNIKEIIDQQTELLGRLCERNIDG
jgi:hypothetical protein